MLFAIALGAFMGWFNGMLTAYAGIPAFIVTLGGLIAYSGIAWALIRGETVAPMDKTFKLIGGNGPLASIGPFWSWVLAAIACAGSSSGCSTAGGSAGASNFPSGRSGRKCLLAACGGAAILGATAVVNSYPWAPKVIEPYAKDNGIPIPPGVEARDGDAICMAGERSSAAPKGWSSTPAMRSRCSSRSRSAS